MDEANTFHSVKLKSITSITNYKVIKNILVTLHSKNNSHDTLESLDQI